MIAACGLVLGLLTTSAFAEVLLRKFHSNPRSRTGAGSQVLQETLMKDLHRLIPNSPPRITLLENPSVTVFQAKSLFSKSGTIYLSQGVLNLLSREELEAVLMSCFHRSHDPILKLQSLGAVLASAAVHAQLLPRQWVRILLFETPAETVSKRNPFSFILFFVFFPLFQAILYLSGAPSKQGKFSSKNIGLPTLDHAMQKLFFESQRCASENNPGAVRLCLLNPWPNSLLSVN